MSGHTAEQDRSGAAAPDAAPDPGAAPPALSRTVLRSTDLDETRDVVAQAFCPHSLQLPDAAAALATRYRGVQVGDIGVTLLDYGAPVRIATQGSGDFFLVEIPLGGRSTITTGGDTVVADRSTGAVLCFSRPVTTTRAASSPQLIVRIERTALEDQLHVMLGRPVRSPLRLATAMDLTAGGGRSWRRLVDLLRAESEQDGTLVHAAVRAQFRSLLLTQLLSAQPSNYSDALQESERPPLSRSLQRAVDLIHDHAAEPLTVEDVALATGISVRALQQGFRRHVGSTPTEYLRDVRLDRVHEALRSADPGTVTVTDIACRWGFSHLGRFAGDYRRRFAESPSTTLRR